MNALVLHQMACCRRRREGGYDRIGSHFAILPDGRILQLHPVEVLVYASNGFNRCSVAVEFAGNFPNTRGRCWNASAHGCQQLTRAQVEAGRYLVDHLRKRINLKYIFAHRQSSATRENDPGPDIWFRVGQWAIDRYGLSDGGPGFHLKYRAKTKARIKGLGDGRPIPDSWRTWGRRGSVAGASSPGNGRTVQPGTSGNILSFLTSLLGIPAAVVKALSSGQEQLALRLAIARGERSANTLTNMIFFARHPRRQGKKLVKGEPGFRQLAQEWLQIRDRLVNPALRALPAPARSPGTTGARSRKISPRTVARIDRYARLIDSVARARGVDPNIVRGIIAAESGGNPESGRGGGYKGLMQAGTGREQLDPQTSIRSGVAHFLKKQVTVNRILRSFGIRYRSLKPDTQLLYVMTAYNAGEGTLKKTLQLARKSGDVRRWQEPAIFQRALLFTGAYSVRAPLRWCLNRMGPEAAARTLSTLTGQSATSLQRTYYRAGKGWDGRRLRAAFGTTLLRRLRAEKKQLRHDDTLTVARARQKASPLLLCSVEFKHVHRPGYIDKILAYKRYYEQRR